MAKQVIAVLGGTGGQGGGVVEALLGLGQFTVRVASRNPAGDAAKALARRGVEVVKADLLDAASLRLPFEGAYGAFVVTNFWDPAQMPRETEIGAAAVKAARSFGVKHIVWSTLPDCESLTGGRLKVVHFTGKARVDPAVEAAGFPRYTFVQAPMYFQNFLTMNTPQPLPGGGRGWAVPMGDAAEAQSRARAVGSRARLRPSCQHPSSLQVMQHFPRLRTHGLGGGGDSRRGRRGGGTLDRARRHGARL